MGTLSHFCLAENVNPPGESSPNLHQEEGRHPHIQDRDPGPKACNNKPWDPSNSEP